MDEASSSSSGRLGLAGVVRALSPARRRLFALNMVLAILWPAVVVLLLFDRSLWLGIAVVVVGAILFRLAFRHLDARLARSSRR